VIAAQRADREEIERSLALVVDPGRGAGSGVRVRKQRSERHTTHYWVEAQSPAGTVRYFVKRYQPPLRRNLITLVAASRVRREYENSRRAVELGLNAVPAIAYAERRHAGIVVDQWIVFEDVGRCQSAADVFDEAKRFGRTAKVRAELLDRFATELRDMHERGYSHLAISPRNLLRVASTARYSIIDHNAAIVFPRSIHATRDAIPDLLNLFDSERLFPAKSGWREFLERYAPGAESFHAEVATALRSNVSSDRARRQQKVRALIGR
jgi:Lipopolysaccharide kinase (Kdo/WaaP) family